MSRCWCVIKGVFVAGVIFVATMLSVNSSYAWVVPYAPGVMDYSGPKPTPFDKKPESKVVAMLLAGSSEPTEAWNIPVVVKVLRILKEKHPFLKDEWRVDEKGFYIPHERRSDLRVAEVLWDGTYKVFDPNSFDPPCLYCKLKLIVEETWESLLKLK